MSIKLQSTVGGFTPEFMRNLPLVEADMRAHGLEPSEFVISKDRAAPPAVPLMSPFFYDYTVFVGDDSFTVTEPNDMTFLAFFHKRCIAEDDERCARGDGSAHGEDMVPLHEDDGARLERGAGPIEYVRGLERDGGRLGGGCGAAAERCGERAAEERGEKRLMSAVHDCVRRGAVAQSRGRGAAAATRAAPADD